MLLLGNCYYNIEVTIKNYITITLQLQLGITITLELLLRIKLL